MAFFYYSPERGDRPLELFKIFGTIALENADAIKGMKETTSHADNAASSMEAAFSRIGSAALKVGKVIAAGLAAGATAVGALAKISLDSYADYEQLVGGSQLLFGDAYDYVAEKAANAYSTVQMSQNEYLQQVNGFATGLKTALGGNEQAAAELAHKIIQAEADVVAATGNTQEAVQNAFNGIMKSNYTMLDNLQLGITPTKEGFQELIDKVNEWNAANGEATKYQIDNLADCQSALVDYIEMQGLAEYAANEAAGTIQGAMSMAKAAWKNLLTGFADSEQDLGVLVSNLADSVTTAARLIVPRLAQIFGGISDALAMILPVISAELPGLLEQLLPGVIEGATSLIVGLISALPSILEILIEQLPSIISQLAEGIAATFPVLLQTVEGLFGQIWDYISLSLLNTGVSFEEMKAKASEAFSTLWGEAQQTWSAIGEPLLGMVQDRIGILKNVFSEKFPEMKAFASSCFSDIADYWNNHLQPCLEAIGNFIENVLAPIFAEHFESNIRGSVEVCFEAIKLLWEEILKPVLTGITDFLTGVFSGNWQLAWSGIVSIVDGAMMTTDEAIMGLITGAVEKFNQLVATVSEKWTEIKTKTLEKWAEIKGVFADALSVGKKIIDDIKQGIIDKWQDLVSWFSGIWNSLFGNLSVNVGINKGVSGGGNSGGVVMGSHASGLDYVPFDGYIAELHKGEMVLPANDANALRSGTVANYEIANILTMILDAIQEGNSQDTVVKLNNREVGRIVKAVN